MFRSVSLLVSSLLFCQFSFSQGIIVNEASQGTGGTQEFIELLVVGSDVNPTQNVDLQGWKVDDMNGEFGPAAQHTRIGDGHIELGACFSDVPIGSLIVLYNPSDRNVDLPADDPTDSDNDGVYILPVNDGCMNLCRDFPYFDDSKAIPLNNSYTCTNDSATGGLIQNLVGFNNSGDAVQVRRPNGDFFHGYSFGSITAPAFSFNVPPASGGNQSYIFSCGDWNNAGNFANTNANNQTPGEPNSPENSILIQNIQNGYFDYSNPNRLDHCANVLNSIFTFFQADLVGRGVDLSWKIRGELLSEVRLERKTMSGVFQSLESFKPQENQQFYTDALPTSGKNIYRLKLTDIQGATSYSNQLEVWVGDERFSRMFPNPTKDQLFLDFASPAYRQVSLVNALGQQVMNPQIFTEENGSFSLETMSEGMYWLKILHENGRVELKKVIKSR